MLVVNKMYSPEIGGVEVVVKLMADIYKKHIGFVEVLTFSDKGDDKNEIIDSVPVKRIGSFFSKGPIRLSWTYMKKLKECSKNHNLILYNYPSVQPEICTLFLNTDRKQIVSYHADNVKWGIVGYLYQKTIARQFLKKMDLILVSNPNIVTSSMELRRVKNKCVVLPLGVDTDHFQKTMLDADDLHVIDQSKKKIVFVGRFSRYKGLNVLLNAFSQLDENYQLILVSKDRIPNNSKEIIEKNRMNSRVIHLNNISHTELPKYYSVADVFVMPSTDRGEAFGLVAVEAMACGIPVITTELGTGTSYHNIDGVTGKVIQPNDIIELREAILEICENPERFDEGAIRKRALEFDQKIFEQKLIEILNNFGGIE